MSQTQNEKIVESMLMYQVASYHLKPDAEHYDHTADYSYPYKFSPKKVKKYYENPDILGTKITYNGKKGTLIDLLLFFHGKNKLNLKDNCIKSYLALLIEGVLATNKKTIATYQEKHLEQLFKAMSFITDKLRSLSHKEHSPFEQLSNHQQLVSALLQKFIDQYKSDGSNSRILLETLLDSIKNQTNHKELFNSLIDKDSNNIAHLFAKNRDRGNLEIIIKKYPDYLIQYNSNGKQPLELYQISAHSDDIFSLISQLDPIKLHPSIIHILKQNLEKCTKTTKEIKTKYSKKTYAIIEQWIGKSSEINEKINFNKILELALELQCNDVVRILSRKGLSYLTNTQTLAEKIEQSSVRQYVLPIEHKSITEHNIKEKLSIIPVYVQNQGQALVALVKNSPNLKLKIKKNLENHSFYKKNILRKLTNSLIILTSKADAEEKKIEIKQIIQILAIYTLSTNYRCSIENIKAIVEEIKQCVNNDAMLSPYGEILSFIANSLILRHGYEKVSNSSTALLLPPQIIHASSSTASYYITLITTQIDNIELTEDLIVNIIKAFSGLTTQEKHKQAENIAKIIDKGIKQAELDANFKKPLKKLVNRFFEYSIINNLEIKAVAQLESNIVPQLNYYKLFKLDEKKIEQQINQSGKAEKENPKQDDTGMSELVLGYKKMSRQNQNTINLSTRNTSKPQYWFKLAAKKGNPIAPALMAHYQQSLTIKRIQPYALKDLTSDFDELLRDEKLDSVVKANIDRQLENVISLSGNKDIGNIIFDEIAKCEARLPTPSLNPDYKQENNNNSSSNSCNNSGSKNNLIEINPTPSAHKVDDGIDDNNNNTISLYPTLKIQENEENHLVQPPPFPIQTAQLNSYATHNLKNEIQQQQNINTRLESSIQGDDLQIKLLEAQLKSLKEQRSMKQEMLTHSKQHLALLQSRQNQSQQGENSVSKQFTG